MNYGYTTLVSSESDRWGFEERSRLCEGPCEPARRRSPFPAGASVRRGPGGSPGLEAGRDSAPTCRSNVTRSPDTGGLAVPARRRSAERETVLAVTGCGPAAGEPPYHSSSFLLRHDGLEGEWNRITSRSPDSERLLGRPVHPSGVVRLVPSVLDQLPWGAAGVLPPHPLVGHGESFLGRHGFSR